MTGSLKNSRQIAQVSSFFKSSPVAAAVAMFSSQTPSTTLSQPEVMKEDGGDARAHFVPRDRPLQPIRIYTHTAAEAKITHSICDIYQTV